MQESDMHGLRGTDLFATLDIVIMVCRDTSDRLCRHEPNITSILDVLLLQLLL
jgi:hypothetical protein